MLTCLFPFTLSLWLVTKKMINWLVCSFKWACYESFKQGGLGRRVWYSPDATTLPRWCNDALVLPPPAIVGDINDWAAQTSTWAFWLFWYITSWLRGRRGDVIPGLQLPSPSPPPTHIPIALTGATPKPACSTLLSKHCLKRVARLFTKRLQHQLSAYMKK